MLICFSFAKNWSLNAGSESLRGQAGWVFNDTPQQLYLRERDPVTVVHEAGWESWSVWKVRKISSPPGFKPRIVRPASSSYSDNATPATSKLSTLFIIYQSWLSRHPHGSMAIYLSSRDTKDCLQWQIFIYLQFTCTKYHVRSTSKFTDTSFFFGRNSLPGTANRYGLDGSGFKPGAKTFSAPVHKDMKAHPVSCKMGTGTLSRGQSGRNVALTIHHI
jgi:hypothetical protein